MNDKLQTKIRQVEEEHAGEVLDARLEEYRQGDRDRALFILGGINIADRVAESLGSEAIKAMVNFQEQKLYTSLGYDTFVDFLAQSEFTRMTKQQFYDRKALLEKEGEAMFDLLTELGISIRKRKLLGQGNVELAGDRLVVHNGEETTEIALDDRSQILDAITALADANAEKSHKLDRQKEKLEKHAGEKRELYDEIDRVKASKMADASADPHMIALVELGLAFSKLTAAAANLPPVEKQQFHHSNFEKIAAWMADLADAYAVDIDKVLPKAAAATTGDGDFDSIFERAMADDDNEAELAAIL